jgi:hypothetical protein
MIGAGFSPAVEQRLRRAALAALDLEPAEMVAFVEWLAERRGAGCPVPPFGAIRDEARDWSEWATLPERRAYFEVCWQTLPERDRAVFLRWATERRAAA